MKLAEKVVFITGAARGLGRAAAVECAREGADVVVHYTRSAGEAAQLVDEIRALGRRALAVQADVGDYPAIDHAITNAVNEFGRIDVLVNNAGVLIRSLLMTMDVADFATVIRTNLIGPFHCIKAVGRHMIKQKSGVIINLSSVAGERALVGQGAYGSSKGGIHVLTGTAAKEFARYNIRVNAVAPGAIDAGMTSSLPEEYNNKYVNDIPLKRYGKADEVAKAIVFLASNESSYITGHVLHIDGGLLC